MGWYDDILNYLASPRQQRRYITNPSGIASVFPKGTTPRTSRAFLPGGRKYRYDQFDREQDNLSSFEQKRYYRKGVPSELFRGDANATYGPGGANIGPRYAQPSPTAGGPLSPVRPNFLPPTRTAPRTNAQGRLNSASFQPVPEAVFTPVSQAIVGPRKEGDVLGPIVDGVSNERFRPVPPVEGQQLTEAQRQLRARAREANAPPSMAPILRSVARGDGPALVNNLLKAGVGAFKGQMPDISRSVASAERVANSARPAIDQLSGNAPTIRTSSGRRVNVAPGSTEAKAMAAPVSAVAIDPFGRRTGGYTDSRAFTDEPGAIPLSAVQGANAAPVAKSARASAVPLPMPRPVRPVAPVAPDAPGLPRREGRDDLSEYPLGPNDAPVDPEISDRQYNEDPMQDASQSAEEAAAQATAKDPVQEPVDEKSFLDNEWVRLGLNMMVAASKPGATALGAFGEGALATISDRDKRRVINEDRAFKKEVLELKAGYDKAEGDRGRAVARERLQFAFRQHADAEKRFAKDFGLKEKGLIDRQLMSEAEISNIESNIEHRKEMRRIGQLSSEEDKKLAYLTLDSSRKKSDKTLLSAIYRSAGVAIKELMDSLENSGEFQEKTPEEKVEFVKKAYTSFTSNRAGDPATADVIKSSFGQTIIDGQIRILFPKASTDPFNVR